MQEMQEMWVQSLGWEDPLEEEMVTHCSILAWRIPWTEELTSMGSQRAGDACVTEHAYTFIIFYGQVFFESFKKNLLLS